MLPPQGCQSWVASCKDTDSMQPRQALCMLAPCIRSPEVGTNDEWALQDRPQRHVRACLT